MSAAQTQCTACGSTNVQKIQVLFEKESFERLEGESPASSWRVTTHYRCVDCGYLFHVTSHVK